MYHTAMLPTIGKSTPINGDLMKITFVLNRWMKMLIRYGQLDPTSINNDFSLISKVIKGNDVKRSVKEAIARCRDYALAGSNAIDKLISSLEYTLGVLCACQEDKSIKRVKQQYADQGMTERYRPLSKRLAREKIRKIGKEISFTDPMTDGSKTTKLVRRIVEKRAAQAVFRNVGTSAHKSSRFRQSVRRATSFSLFNASFTDYDQSKRAKGTHWKVKYYKFGRKLKSKKSFNSFEEAQYACINYNLTHLNEPRQMGAYKCDYCGKWHIGHTKRADEVGRKMATAS